MTDIEQKITNTLLQRPLGLEISGRHFYLYPMTLGRSFLTGSLVRELGLDFSRAGQDINGELARILGTHLDECLRIIAYSTLEGDWCLHGDMVEDTVKFLKENADAEDMLFLLQTCLKNEGVRDIEHHFGIDGELREYSRIAQAKEDSGSYTFCGKSVWGSLVSALAEKYGWKLDYILWGISLDNISLLLADAPKTIYLSDKERSRIHPKRGKDTIKADDPRNREMILAMNWD